MKVFSKKRTGAKSSSRYSRKKTSPRTFKKGGTTRSTKSNAAIAKEVSRILSSGAQNEKRKVTLEMLVEEPNIFINGKDALKTCLRLPITDAIPAMAGVGHGPDVRRRTSNKIVVTGVNVRASFSASDETRVMLMAYEPHGTVLEHLKTHAPIQTEPSAVAGMVPERFTSKRVGHFDMALVSKHGPLMTKKWGKGLALDTVDGTVFECRTSTHAGKPIGAVFKKKFGGGLRRTVNWDQTGQPAVGKGYTAWTTHTINEYWKLGKEYTYSHEVLNDQVFERSAELLLYVDCPSEQRDEIDEDTVLIGAVMRSVIVDIYYHDK